MIKKKQKKFKQRSLSIIKHGHDDEEIFVNDIKFLLTLLHDNILEEQADAMDPDETVFENKSQMPGLLPMLSSNEKQILIRSLSSKQLYVSPSDKPINSKTNNRLRGNIKRKHTDTIFRWLNVGCGSCFLHESSGTAKEIGSTKGTDYENEFPKQLQRAMFLYYIDCRLPFNEDIISQESQCA
eukprot:159211_1